MIIQAIRLYPCRIPLDRPVITSFGKMTARSSLLIAVEDPQGYTGWGECWCNFPSGGMAYKQRLYQDTLAPHLRFDKDAEPHEITTALHQSLRVIACQTGDSGSVAQILAGLDIALWDLRAKQLDLPLAAVLNPHHTSQLPIYASGIDRREIAVRLDAARSLGIERFKLKVGFDPVTDLDAITSCLTQLAPEERLAVDANQGWSLATAMSLLPDLPSALSWIEEPILADEPFDHWLRLQELTSIRLSGGENFLHQDDYDRYFQSIEKPFPILQPDVCKWGGITGISRLFPNIDPQQTQYYPHFLGSAIGLAASAHLLAAEGGGGLLEYDIQPNALRDALGTEPLPIKHGHYQISDRPGLGIEPRPEVLNTWCEAAIPLDLAD